MAYTTGINTLGEVELASQPLSLVPGTYVKSPISPFAPRIATQNPSHGTLDAWQSESITDWSHGMGFVDFVDPSGYNFTAGNIDTRHPNQLQMYTAQTTPTNSPGGVPNVFQDYYDGANNYLYAGLATTSPALNGSTVWYHNGTTWANMHTVSSNASVPQTAVTDLLASADSSGNKLLFVAKSNTSDIAFQVWNGGTWATPLNAAYAKFFAHAGGYMWYANRVFSVYYSSDPTGAWSSPINVGNVSHAITSLCEFNGRLYIGKVDGLYYIDTQNLDYAFPAVKFETQLDQANFAGMRVWQGYLYFAVSDRLFRMSPAHAISDITPAKFTTTFPYAMMQGFRAFTPARAFLYYAAQDSSTSIWWQCAFDGIGHHRLAPLGRTAVSAVSQRGGYYSQIASARRLWFGTAATNGASSSYYTSLNQSELPYDNYITTNAGTNYLETSRMNFSLPEVIKNWQEITLEVENYAAGRAVDVQFALDDSTVFHSMATLNASITSGAYAVTAVGGTYANNNTVGTIDWVNMSNVATDGADAASVNGGLLTAPDVTKYLYASNFGFTIPSTATVTGVVLQLKVSDGNPAVDSIENSIRLFADGAFFGDDKATLGVPLSNYAPLQGGWPSTAVYFSYGAATDLWGATSLSAGQVNASDFGVGVSYTRTSAGTSIPQIYYISLTVYYTLPDRYITIPFNRLDGSPTNATSSTTVMYDTTNLVQPDNFWTHATVDVVGGTGAGQTREVASSSRSDKSTTLTQAWTTIPDTTSIYQITWQSRVIRFRLVFTTSSSSNSIVLKSLTVRFEPRPEMKLGWQFVARAADNMENSVGAVRGGWGAEDIAALGYFWRNTKAPIKYRDVDGQSYFVMVTDIRATELGYDPTQTESQSDREYGLAMTLAQA